MFRLGHVGCRRPRWRCNLQRGRRRIPHRGCKPRKACISPVWQACHLRWRLGPRHPLGHVLGLCGEKHCPLALTAVGQAVLVAVLGLMVGAELGAGRGR